jgi:hypothetical protein
MRFLLQAAALASLAAASPGLAQEAPSDTAARLEAMICREFLAFDAAGQETVKAAMLAHLADEPLPNAPLPDPAAAGQGASDDGPEVVEDETGTDGSGSAGAGEAPEAAAAAGEAADADSSGEGANESGKVAPDGTEASLTDEAGDSRLVAMRTSCEGGPDARALDALRAAFGNNL